MRGRYAPRGPARPWSCAFAIADATAVFTWLRMRRTLEGMDECTEPSARAKKILMKSPAHVPWKKVNIAELARVTRPEELVWFGAPEHVELGRAFLDCRANRQRHEHQADAVLLVLVVEPVLVEVKGVVI